MPSYVVHNLTLYSDTPVRGVECAPEAGAYDVRIQLELWPNDAPTEPTCFFSDPVIANNGRPVLQAWRDLRYFLLRYDDGAEFLIDCQGAHVWVRPHDAPLDLVSAYLLGPVLGFLLRLRGRLCLHATVVQIGSAGFAVVGPCGSGKSTLAASFGHSGYPVLSDDVVAVTEHAGDFVAHPSGIHFKLWPDSADIIYGALQLPRLVADTEKRVIEFRDAVSTKPSSAPLRSIFLLGDRSPDPRAPSTTPVSGAAALVALACHTYANYLLTPEMRTQEFEALYRLVTSVPVLSVTPSDDFAKLPELRELLCSEFQKSAH